MTFNEYPMSCHILYTVQILPMILHITHSCILHRDEDLQQWLIPFFTHPFISSGPFTKLIEFFSLNGVRESVEEWQDLHGRGAVGMYPLFLYVFGRVEGLGIWIILNGDFRFWKVALWDPNIYWDRDVGHCPHQHVDTVLWALARYHAVVGDTWPGMVLEGGGVHAHCLRLHAWIRIWEKGNMSCWLSPVNSVVINHWIGCRAPGWDGRAWRGTSGRLEGCPLLSPVKQSSS